MVYRELQRRGIILNSARWINGHLRRTITRDYVQSGQYDLEHEMITLSGNFIMKLSLNKTYKLVLNSMLISGNHVVQLITFSTIKFATKKKTTTL